MSDAPPAEWVPIADLVPWADNPRDNDAAVAQVAESIRRFGFASPIIARRADREVIAGHTRLKAAQLLGLTQVPVRYMDLDPVEARLLALADNRLGEIATWSDDLARVIGDLQAAGGQTGGLGWSDEEIAGLLDRDDPAPTPEPEAAAPVYVPAASDVHLGDCLAWLRSLPDASVDAIVTDPPYGLSPDGRARTWDDVEALRASGQAVAGAGFMGRKWDAAVPGITWARECLRVLKPGGHIVAFASDRTVHRLACAIEDAGFEVRHQLGWVYYSGFPKSLDVLFALDKHSGHERPDRETIDKTNNILAPTVGVLEKGRPVSPEAQRWSGWGTALKPAIEPAVLARKPFPGTVAENVLAHGTGAINIDGCRFAFGDTAWIGPNEENPPVPVADSNPGKRRTFGHFRSDDDGHAETFGTRHPGGRWPANLYATPKPSRTERERGTEALPAVDAKDVGDRAAFDRHGGDGRKSEDIHNHHPTVKPVRLMRWLVRLVTPPGGLAIDPFTGSGTTGIAAALERVRFAGAEREPEYHAIAVARIAHAQAHPDEWADTAPGAP